MTPEQAKALANEWHGEAGGELLPQLTANELAGIVTHVRIEALEHVLELCDAMPKSAFIATIRMIKKRLRDQLYPIS